MLAIHPLWLLPFPRFYTCDMRHRIGFYSFLFVMQDFPLEGIEMRVTFTPCREKKASIFFFWCQESSSHFPLLSKANFQSPKSLGEIWHTDTFRNEVSLLSSSFSYGEILVTLIFGSKTTFGHTIEEKESDALLPSWNFLWFFFPCLEMFVNTTTNYF